MRWIRKIIREELSKYYLLKESVDADDMKRIGKSFLNFKDSQINDFVDWINKFPTSGRAPKGKTKEFERIKEFKKYAETYKEYGLIPLSIKSSFSWLNEDYIDTLVDMFFSSGPERIDSIQMGNYKFVNDSLMSASRFKETSKQIANFLNRFTGFHKKALNGNLEIHFKSSKAMKSKAVYKGEYDQIWIRESNSRDVATDEYASLLYIIVHELAHRVERKFGLPKSFRDEDFYTTRYSRVDSLGGSECFAEIFAISFFGKGKYPQFSDKIDKFNKLTETV